MGRQLFYGFAVFVSSAAGLVIEIVAGRLIAPYVGMSLYTWTAIIAVVLAGLSLGHWVGGYLAAPHVDPKRGARRVAGALAAASVSSLAILVLIRTVSGALLASGIGMIPAIVLLTGLLFFLPSFFVGIVSPILTKLAIDSKPGAHGAVIGRMYALGTLGSIAGTLLAGYFFISWIGSVGTVIMVAGVYAALALAFAIADPLRLMVLAGLAVGLGGLGTAGATVEAFRNPCDRESDYFCIRVADFSPESGRDSALMVLDHLVHSINDRADPGLLYSPYIHFVDEMTKQRFGPELPPKAFFIGGGGYSLPRAWATDYLGLADLTVAEVDPAVTEVATTKLWLDPTAPGLEITHTDARLALQSLPRVPSFDVIFGDAFRDVSIPAHLVTAEFHREIKARLKPDGFYVVNVVDLGADPRFLFSLVRTLNRDFSQVEVWRDTGEAGGPGRVTFILLASDRPSAAGQLSARRGIPRTWRRWPPAQLAQAMAERAQDTPVLTDDFAPVDRLMAHILLSGEEF